MIAADLAQQLGARRSGRSWTAKCPACGYPRALRIAEGESDDQGKPTLLLSCFGGGCDFRGILRAAGLHLNGEVRPGITESRLPRPDRASDAERSAWAHDLWSRSLPAAGTVVEAYLRARRLSLPTLDSIRYLPRAKHRETQTQHPTMIAAVTRWPEDAPVAVHRTFLAADGSGKAAVEPQRKTLGPIAGGAVRLGEARPGRSLAVAEGIESALAASVLLDLPAWAAISAGNLEVVELPPFVQSVFLVADNDRPGLRHAYAAASRWRREGRSVQIIRPDLEGCGDANDLLLRSIQ